MHQKGFGSVEMQKCLETVQETAVSKCCFKLQTAISSILKYKVYQSRDSYMYIGCSLSTLSEG